MGAFDQLAKSAIFEGISPEVGEDLCALGRQLDLEAGHRLFDRGQDANDLMILAEGVVELFFPVEIMGVTRELTMESKQAGDVVAWSALVSPYRLTLSARCASNCKLFALSRDSLLSYFDAAPQVGNVIMRNLAGVIGRRLQALQTVWIRELQASAVKRLE
jgi:CRP-like cAMP-binding protein